MQLLTQLQQAVRPAPPDAALAALVPRLWPFFRHTLASVRLATVRCLAALLADAAAANVATSHGQSGSEATEDGEG